MGLALAEQAARRGAEVTLVAANVSLAEPAGVRQDRRRDRPRELAGRGRDGVRALPRAADGGRGGRLPAGAGRARERSQREGAEAWRLDLERTEDVLAGGRAPAHRRADRRGLRGRARRRGDQPRPREARAQGPRRDRLQRRLAVRHRLRLRAERGRDRRARRASTVSRWRRRRRWPTRSSTASRRFGQARRRRARGSGCPDTLPACLMQGDAETPLRAVPQGCRVARGRQLQRGHRAARRGGAAGAREELGPRGPRPRLLPQTASSTEAAQEFEAVVERYPVNDYAHFCLGRALTLTGQRDRARHHLALASNLRPERRDYGIYRERLAAQARVTDSREGPGPAGRGVPRWRP